MAKCPFLREQSSSCFFLIFIAIASSRRARWVSAKANDPSELKTAAAALQRGAHRNPDIKSELAVPAFLQRRSIMDKTQPVQLAQLGYLPSYLRPANTVHDGDRRVQDSCATQSTTFNTCLPDDQCKSCYEGFIESAFQQTLCGQVELELCSIATNCPSCGCESQAEIYYQCLLKERGGCDNVVDCTDSKCDAEFLAVAACDDTLATPCTACVGEPVTELLANDPLASCVDLERTVCPAIYDTCGCSYCADKVNSWYTCSYADICPDLECSAPVAPSPATPNAGSPMAAPVAAPASTPFTPPVTRSLAPTYSDPCYVCGDPGVMVDVTKTVKIGDNERSCVDVQADYAASQQTSPFECNILMNAVKESCNCQDDVVQPPTVKPSSTPVASPVAQGSTSPSGRGGGSLAALSALVAIPLLAAIVYLVKHKKRGDGSASNKPPSNSADPVDDYKETPPSTPSSNRRHAHTPASQHQQTDLSRTTSVRSDEDYIYGRRHDDRDLGSIGDVSAGSGRSQDILRASAAKYPVPNASPVLPVRSTGEHALVNKDCCRSVACEAEVPVAVIVEEVVPPGVDRVYEKRGADP